MTDLKGTLILLRHGASVWNEKNLFTGWIDIPLSFQGIQEATVAGKKIASYPIDAIFTSTLIRSQMTAMIAMLSHGSGKTPYFVQPDGLIPQHQEQDKGQEMIPVHKAWQLNERMYGKLQGKNKAEVSLQFGADQVRQWRRGFDVLPPEGESLKMTSERTLPYFKEQILTLVMQGKTILVVAHGNSLRSIVMMLEMLSEEDVVQLEIPTGGILTYHHNEGKWECHERR
ncbi:MAG: histidine phosphatase family protein [Candidatus Rhabdochlamydia sp.]